MLINFIIQTDSTTKTTTKKPLLLWGEMCWKCVRKHRRSLLMRIHLDVLDAKDIKFTPTWSSAVTSGGIPPFFSSCTLKSRSLTQSCFCACVVTAGVSLLRFFWDSCPLSPSLLQWLVAAVSHRRPRRSRAPTRHRAPLTSPGWVPFTRFSPQTHPPTPPISCSAGAAGWTGEGGGAIGFSGFHPGKISTAHPSIEFPSTVCHHIFVRFHNDRTSVEENQSIFPWCLLFWDYLENKLTPLLWWSIQPLLK